MSDRPRIGIGVIVVNSDGKVLVGKRKGVVPKYSIPGGSLEEGETFEQCAIREIKEETDLEVTRAKVFALTNNLETYKEIGTHWISIEVLAEEWSGEPKNMEPEKCEGWQWCDPTALPEPHFEASRLAVQCYLEKKFYVQ